MNNKTSSTKNNSTEDINDTLAIREGFGKPILQKSMEVYDDFLANSEVDRIQKLILKYELFKMTLDVPGDVVECGVQSGSGIYLYAKLMKIFKPHSISRIVGFDFFGSENNTISKYKADQECIEEHQNTKLFGAELDTILKNLNNVGIDNVDLIPGDVIFSTKDYVEKHLGFRISLLVLDVDNYEGTLACLENLYPLVTKGGVVVFDEYALRTYGESNAVDEYFKNQKIKIKSFSWGVTPSGYLIKE